MAGAKLGDKIKFHFVMKDEAGEIVEQSTEEEPAEIVLGEGDFFSGIEVSLTGMNPGETKTITLKPTMHYGPYVEELKVELSKDQIPDDIEPEKGAFLEYTYEDDSSDLFTIVEIGDDTVTIDGNHPLAGKDLTIELKLLNIET